MLVERTTLNALVENKLPDGSTILIDSANETVFALNATAGAAWDACAHPTTLAGVTESMRGSLDAGISGELAEQAILELSERNLVATSGPLPRPTRRELFRTLGAVALPLVVSLTLADQKAHAQQARSSANLPSGHDGLRPYPRQPSHKPWSW
jgi:hypothetical protein